MHWYLEALKKYALFNGRARRKEYWYFFLFNIIITIVLNDIYGEIFGSFIAYQGIGLLGKLYILFVVIPSCAVSVRRLHDTGRSGSWLLIGLVPVFGALVVLVFMVEDSQPYENQYGSNPKTEKAWEKHGC